MRQHWQWARREMAGLDSANDAPRLAHLSFEVRYGAPMFLHGLFSVAFVYNVGMPEMARILYRRGNGPIVRDTRKRNFDSLIFFGELYRHGWSTASRQIAERLQAIHARFPIENAMSLYTLATLACLPERISLRFAGSAGLGEKECEAQFRFWQRIGTWMGVRDIPDTRAAYLQWMSAFERERFSPTVECQAIAKALAWEWADYWFPKPLRTTGYGLFMAMLEPAIRARLDLPRPSRTQAALAMAGIRSFFLAKRMLPDAADRHMSDHFAGAYAQPIDLHKVGYDAWPCIGSRRPEPPTS